MLFAMELKGPHDVRADWVFGYGSLIWNPEIDFERAELARVHGWHRSFCIGSARYRGTPERPGVVLGLDRGGSCIGVAYRLRASTRLAALERIFQREMPAWDDRVYRPMVVEVRLAGSRRVDALTFVADRGRPAYARLSDDEILARLTGCCGQRGPNSEYAINTWRALEERGVHDARLARIARRLLGAAA